MKRNAPRSPKVRQLARLLEVPRYAAVGLLELLWHTTAQLTPRGDIGLLDDDHLAEELAWDGDPAALVDALVTSGWIDRCINHRLVVHDWPDHCDQAVKRSKPVVDHEFVTPNPPDASEASAPASSELVPDASKASVPFAFCRSRLPEPEPAAGQSGASAPPPPAAAPPPGNESGRKQKRSSGRTPPPESIDSLLPELESWARDRLGTSFDDAAWSRIQAYTETCLNHFRGTGEQKANWLATVQNWCGKDENQWRARQKPPLPPLKSRAEMQRLQRAAKRALSDTPARASPEPDATSALSDQELLG